MRDEIVAKICSNCDHFKILGYRCPYVRNLTIAFHTIEDVAYAHKDVFETVRIKMDCVGYCECESRENPTI